MIKETDPKKLFKLNEIFNPSSYEVFYERFSLFGEFSNFNPKKNKIVKKNIFSIKGNPVNVQKKSSLKMYKNLKFKNIVITVNEIFNIKCSKPIKIEENKKPIKI